MKVLNEYRFLGDMTELIFTPEAKWLWTGAMMMALFFPVRKLIWVLTVRRYIKHSSFKIIDDAENKRLFKRASFTAGLITFSFSIIYISKIFTS